MNYMKFQTLYFQLLISVEKLYKLHIRGQQFIFRCYYQKLNIYRNVQVYFLFIVFFHTYFSCITKLIEITNQTEIILIDIKVEIKCDFQEERSIN